MSDLYPTKTRLALLDAVANGEVKRHWTLRMDARDTWRGQRVNARVAELAKAGWATYPPMRLGGGSLAWQITAAGRAVLDTHGGQQT